MEFIYFIIYIIFLLIQFYIRGKLTCLTFWVTYWLGNKKKVTHKFS